MHVSHSGRAATGTRGWVGRQGSPSSEEDPSLITLAPGKPGHTIKLKVDKKETENNMTLENQFLRHVPLIFSSGSCP